jgi:hypothetical protein
MSDTVSAAQELPRGTALEEVWTLFKETDSRMKETDRRMKETDQRMKETDQRMKETDQRMKETDRMIKELTLKTDRQIGRLSNRLGEVIEHLMSPKLHEKFAAFHLRFDHFSRNHEIEDEQGKLLAEIDVLLENGQYAMAVEVKTRLSAEDVQEHLQRMDILRQVADRHDDHRRYLGAVAGAVVDKGVIDYANRHGLYVIIPSGDTVEIEIPEGFKPRTW